MSEPDDTGPKVGNRFQGGTAWNGNKAGRPKGARSKLGEDFIAAMSADFEQHGVTVIEKVRMEKPDQYLKVVASLLPREVSVNTDPLRDMSDDELETRIQQLRHLFDPKQDKRSLC
jgi:hypothetical protein